MGKILGIVSTNYSVDGIEPLVIDRPLAGIPFGGRYRLVDFSLSNLANAGVLDVSIITPANNRSLVDHIGVGREWGFGRKAHKLTFLPGTIFGERIKHSRFIMRDLITHRRFFGLENADYVIICGSNKVYNMDFEKLIDHKKNSPAKATLVYKKILCTNEEGNLYLNIDEDGKVKKIVDKGRGVVNQFLDCAIIDADFFENFLDWYQVFGDMDLMDVIAQELDRFEAFDHADKDDDTDIMPSEIRSFELDTFEFGGYVGMINNLTQYYDASMDLMKPEIRDELFGADRPIYTNVQDRAPSKYVKGAKVSNSLIAGGCVIKGTVENSIIFRSTVVEEGAVIKNSIIMQHDYIGKNAELNHVIADRQVTISEGVSIAGGVGKPFTISKGITL